MDFSSGGVRTSHDHLTSRNVSVHVLEQGVNGSVPQ